MTTSDMTPAQHQAELLDGAALAAKLRAQIEEQVAEFAAKHGRAPGLATVLVGDDPASQVYVTAKRNACRQAGIESFHRPLPADASQAELLDVIHRLAADRHVDGILVQLPLPAHLDADEAIAAVPAEKDVDGLTIENAGRLATGVPGLRPCTPIGVMHLLEHAGVELRGKHAVVLGHSNLFGKPMDRLLLEADATVTQCHKYTQDLPDVCRLADVLIVGVGLQELVRGDWIKPGAVVIDVGITRTDTGLVGDVAFEEAMRVASAITPVPGGVGPMTIACLLENTLLAARNHV